MANQGDPDETGVEEDRSAGVVAPELPEVAAEKAPEMEFLSDAELVALKNGGGK